MWRAHKGDNKLAENCWYTLVKSALDQSTTTQLRNVAGQHPEGDIVRHGDEPQWLATATEQQPPTAPSLPEWVQTPVLRDRSEARWSSVTLMASGTSQVFDRAAAERGLAIHKVLEHARRGDSLETLTQRLHRHKLEPDLAAPLHALLSDAETAPYFSPDAESEATFVGRLDGLEQVQGRVDRLLVTAETVWVLDFKSGRRPGKTPDDHIRQMADLCRRAR